MINHLDYTKIDTLNIDIKDKFSIPCIILAGGKSSRMGVDKSLLPFGEFSTLTEFQYEKLKQIFQTVYISTKNKKKFNFQADFIEDEFSSNIFAPTIAIKTIFQKLKDIDEFFLIAVDTPFLTFNSIKKLIDFNNRNRDKKIIVILYKHYYHPKFKDLLAYYRLDTLAMVMLAQDIEKIIKEN